MRASCLALLLLGPALGAAAQGVVIEHAGVACVVRNKYPSLEARLVPDGDVARARVFFHGDAGGLWYSVDMTVSGGAFHGVLPRPLKDTRRVHYYIEALDRRATSSRTQEYAADVVEDAGACGRKGAVAVALGAARVAVQAPAGAPVLPAGFATAAAAGGIGATALVIGGVAVAGGAAAAVAVSQGKGGQDGSSGNGGSGGSGSTTPPPTTAPPLPNMSLSGTIYNDRCCGTGSISPGPHGQTVAGATISTSVDGTAARSDGQGRFSLVTQTRCPSTVFEYTVTITAPGCDTVRETRTYSCATTDQNYNLLCR